MVKQTYFKCIGVHCSIIKIIQRWCLNFFPLAVMQIPHLGRIKSANMFRLRVPYFTGNFCDAYDIHYFDMLPEEESRYNRCSDRAGQCTARKAIPTLHYRMNPSHLNVLCPC